MPTEKVAITRNKIDRLANAIANKGMHSIPMTVDTMISAINNYSPVANYQSKTVAPTSSAQTITADSGYDALSQVTVNAIPSEYIIPSGTLSITSNGIYNVTNYASANVEFESLEDAFVMGTVPSYYENSRVTKIGSNAFYASSIASISFPNVTEIGKSAFYLCLNLSAVSFPACITFGSTYDTGGYAFNTCSNLETVSFPVLEYLSDHTFGYCAKLSTVNFPACRNIASYAFTNCSGLLEAIFPEASINIGNYAFHFCSKLSSFSAPKMRGYIGANAFQYCYSLTEVSMPLCASAIGNYAFASCFNLISAYFPSATAIGDGAFQSCTKLSYITFTNCINIGNNAFNRCSNLTSAIFPNAVAIGLSYLNNGVYKYSGASSCFSGCSKLSIVSFPKAVGPIAGSAFYGCYSLNSFYAPGINAISTYAFASCRSLEEFTAINLDPNYYNGIFGAFAFGDCYSLSKVVLGMRSSLMSTAYTSISFSGRAFAQCSALKDFYIVNGLFKFLSSCFTNCSLRSLYLLASSMATTVPITNSANYGNITNLSIYVPESMYSSYVTGANWSMVSSRIVSLTASQVQDILNEVIPVIPD